MILAPGTGDCITARIIACAKFECVVKARAEGVRE
jgi:hypothetical protein